MNNFKTNNSSAVFPREFWNKSRNNIFTSKRAPSKEQRQICAEKLAPESQPTFCWLWTRPLLNIAKGVPLFQGAQFAVDTTLVSPLTASGANGTYTGAALHQARRAKERTFPELTRGGRCKLAVLGFERGGRFSNETAPFIRLLASARARSVPVHSRTATDSGLVSRWPALLSHAAHRQPHSHHQRWWGSGPHQRHHHPQPSSPQHPPGWHSPPARV